MTADVGLYTQNKLGGVEGLRHVVVTPGPKPNGLVHNVVFRRQEDNGNAPPLGADTRAQIEPIHTRQHRCV